MNEMEPTPSDSDETQPEDFVAPRTDGSELEVVSGTENQETDGTTFEQLAVEAGFVENSAMTEIRNEIAELSAQNALDIETFRTKFIAYSEAGQANIATDSQYASIGRLVLEAGLLSKYGQAEAAREMLEETMAWGGDVLDQELLQKAVELIVTLETQESVPTVATLIEVCRDHLGEESLAALAECDDIGEANGLAFTMLIEQGIDDPEDFLRERGILQ